VLCRKEKNINLPHLDLDLLSNTNDFWLVHRFVCFEISISKELKEKTRQ